MDIQEALRILELKPGATSAQIKTAYRRFCKVWHPDRFSEPEMKEFAERKQREVNEAYATLIRQAARPGPASAKATPSRPAPRPKGRPDTTKGSNASARPPGGPQASQRRSRGTHGPTTRAASAAPHASAEASQGPRPSSTPTHSQPPPKARSRHGLESLGSFGALMAVCFVFLVFKAVFKVVEGPARPGVGQIQQPAASQPNPMGRSYPQVSDTGPLFSYLATRGVGAEATASPQTIQRTTKPTKGVQSHRPGTRSLGAATASGQGLVAKGQANDARHGPWIELGDSETAVVALLGPPTQRAGEALVYGSSKVFVEGDSVIGWICSHDSPVPVRVSRSVVTPRPCVGMGSTGDEVAATLGTPDAIIGNRWYFGPTYVEFHAGAVAKIFGRVDGNTHICD